MQFKIFTFQFSISRSRSIVRISNFEFQILLVSLVTSVCLLASNHLAFAQQKNQLVLPSAAKLKITPVIIPLQLSPSQNISKRIEVENLTNQPLPLRATFADFETTGEDGGYNFSETASNPLLRWSSVTPSDLIIPAKGKAEVMLTIKTPDKIPVGGYFGMLFFEPVPQVTDKQTTKIVARIGVLMLGTIGVQDNHQANILTFNVPLLTSRKQISTLLRVKNSGLEYITAKPILKITSLFGSQTKDIWEDKVIFPGTTRRWEKQTILPSWWNIYKLNMSVSTGNGHLVSKDKIVIILPWENMLIVIIIVSLIVLIITKRKRLNKVLRILLTGGDDTT